MKRPLCLLTVALIFGICSAYLLNSYLLVVIPAALLTIISAIHFQKLSLSKNLLVLFILFYFIGAFQYLYMARLNTAKFSDFTGEQVNVKGYIDSEPDIRESKVSYVVRTEVVESRERIKKVSGRIVLSTSKTNGAIIDYGRKVEFTGVLNIPKSRRNPGGFDYRKYLQQEGISAAIFAVGSNIKLLDDYRYNYLLHHGIAVRNKITAVIKKSLPEEQAGLLNGMLVGYTEDLGKNVKDDFRDAGLSHIMAVSGMNVAFIVIPLAFLFKRLMIRRQIANGIIIGFLVVFAFVTGMSPSVVRAVIMGIIILLGEIIRRESDVYTSLAVAALLILLFNPFSLFDIGFQLSFIATLSLVLFYKTIRAKLDLRVIPKTVADVLSATFAAQLGVIPISAFYFNKVSIISFVSNLVVVPVTGLITVLGFCMAILGQFSILIAQLIGYINTVFLTFILLITKYSASIPYAAIRVVTPKLYLIAAYYVLVLFFFWIKPIKKIKLAAKYYAAFMIGIIVMIIVSMIIPGKLEVTFLDVGQGDSSFIRTAEGKTILLDGGGSSSGLDTGNNTGEMVIIPFLLDQGITRPDMIIASHGHDDHIQGLIPVMEELGAEYFIYPEDGIDKGISKLIEIAASKGIKVKGCAAGDLIKVDRKTELRVLYPEKKDETDNSALNNSSLVLKLLYKNTSVLFTGDIEAVVEGELAADKDLRSDVIKVAHHGSASSSTEVFIEKVMPSAAVISVGKNNFGHPSQAVVKRILDKNVSLFRTDEDGAVFLTSDGGKISIRKMINR